jgi:hypothetical protein
MHKTLTASALLALVATAAMPLSAAGDGKLPPTAASAGAAQSTWLVVFEAPPLASFTGFPASAGPKQAALAPTSPLATGARRLDAATPAAKAYRAYLEDEREALVARAGAALGRPLAPSLV